MTEAARLTLFTRIFAIGFLASIAFSWNLWLSDRIFPLLPLIPGFPTLHSPADLILLLVFCVVLFGILVRPGSRKLLWTAFGILVFFFLQDQNRMWPSFYEYFFLLLLLLAPTLKNESMESEESAATRVLNACRFVLAAVYFWSGFQKLNVHFFHEQFPWFIKPLVSSFHLDQNTLALLGILAALAQILFAIGLLTRRFRNFALAEAMAMHVLIFFLIGPFRGNWNDSAWIWGLATGVLVFILFYKAPVFDPKTMRGIAYAPVFIFIGIMPFFNNINLWDSALSFNVYTGNVTRGTLYVGDELVRTLPDDLIPFLTPAPGGQYFDIAAWTASEFNANPYPEKRTYATVLKKICSYTKSTSTVLVLREKSSWFDKHGADGGYEYFYCEK